MKKKDITGQKFGLLTAIEFSEEYRYPSGERGEKWLCTCDCGNTVVVSKKNLLNGNSQSCGCKGLKSSIDRLTKHGGKHTRLYDIWCSMKYRCNVHTCKSYEFYGGRGIKICKEWNNDFDAFRTWSYENGYDDTLTIDRIDVNGCYCPENCRWANYEVQANNRTNTIYITHGGETHTCAEWARITGINYQTLHNRVSAGISDEDLFYTGKLKTGPKKYNNIHK